MATPTHMSGKSIPVAPSMHPAMQNIDLQPSKRKLNVRILYISLLAILIGGATGLIGKGLVLVIELFTNIAFYGKFSFEPNSPAGNHLGLFVIAIPAIGGIIVGIMARYGSKAIRGHGIPEAMEQILTNSSKIPPRITFLKPLSSAVAIGTGGPFGAEGPIIATGGALGSFIGQILKTTADERKVLLTAGAAAGMASIFGSPVAAIMLAIELLLFEFSARSLIPISLAVITGASLHLALFGTEAFFAMPDVAVPTSSAIAIYSLIGLIVGVASVGVTKATYIIEDAFEKIPIPWMWHPMIGAIIVGIIGYFSPETLGVGYSNITDTLSGNLTIQVLLALCLMKFISWAVALGSGTSGGTLAPLFTIGGSGGALLGIALVAILPHAGIDIRIAALVGMAAMFAGASRALLTSIIFALETTLQANAFIPLLAGCTAAYIVSYFMMKHNIMTEKIARRGVFVPSSYMPNFTESTMVRQILTGSPLILSEEMTVAEAKVFIEKEGSEYKKKYFALVSAKGELAGVISKFSLNTSAEDMFLDKIGIPVNVIAENMTVQSAIRKFTDYDVNALVVMHHETHAILGVLTQKEVLKGYRNFELKQVTPELTFSIRSKMRWKSRPES